ncbi:MAG: endolytic transglycosylase MltG [Deltaproteobacteria bacterium]|nr:MAG: endolytic transglycosylase MltG [Deltaproteobacteria bacterium]
MKFLKNLAFTVVVLFLCALFAIGFNFLIFLYTPSSPIHPVYLQIPRAASFRKITSILKSKNLISNPYFFLALGKYKKVTSRMQSGEYLIPPQTTPLELMSILSAGRVILHSVTFPEGMTVREMANLLESKSICSSYRFYNLAMRPHRIGCLNEEFRNLEGALFPDTYLFPRNYPPALVIKKMLKRFCKIYTPAMRKRAKEIGMTDREVITLASIIEKEALLKREMPIISSVFHNRLKKGMRLQSDPTVIYDIPYFTGKLKKEDLKRPTPHNTYRFKGLPPDPICNPGKTAILAALYPAKTNYLYFVARNDGTHVFSETLDQHNIAVLLYQRQPPVPDQTTPDQTTSDKANSDQK